MKILFSIICTFLFASIASSSIIVGREKCTYGPSYWCTNLINAKSCGAVKHCIKTVWEKQHVPEDTDSICKICLDMVAQARDQLESNETQEELKEVFDGSCDLIPINVVKKECKRLADDFIPELVEALASQMNPQVVCSTAGLCNNAKIDAMLRDYELHRKNLLGCNQCNSIGTLITQKFHTSTRDDVLNGFLSACGRLSSFSDACLSIVLTYFNEIYEELSRNLSADSICHISGVCGNKYHTHASAQIEIEVKSNIGVLKNKELTDDIPCELCEQLVKHLHDILVANTTEIEFKSVFQGLCSQTKGFKSECLDLVNQYYSVIYETLVNNLDANGACFLIGVCRKGDNSQVIAPHMPLLPSNQKNIPKRKHLGENEKLYSNEQIKTMILPIDQLMGAKSNLNLVDGGEKCTLCQYFLHYLQEELTDEKNEDEIKEMIGKICDKFSPTIRSNCHQFIDLYGDAIIALLVQSIDPRDICPNLKLCPKFINQDVDIFAPYPVVEVNESSKTQCPLCILVVKEAQNYIKSEKSVETAKKALDKACSKLPTKLQLQCRDFVDTYYDELLKKLLSDFTPQDICVDLKLCTKIENDIRVEYVPHINTNEIHDTEIIANVVAQPAFSSIKKNSLPRIQIIRGNDDDNDSKEKYSFKDDPICILCEFVMAKLETELKDKKTQEEIKEAVENICSKMPKSVSKQCTKFVDQYSELIISLIDTVPPKEICTQMGLCVAIKKEMHLVGANECTYGPTHFCSDAKIAEKCKATKYCKEKKLGKFAA